jgi:hypothetical protein
MTKLGSYQSTKDYRAWETQRLLNAAPEWAKVRAFPGSVGNQLLNPIGSSLQETVQQLYRERYNMFLSLADLTQLDTLYRVNLPEGMAFNYLLTAHDIKTYVPPTVYATIRGTEYEITQAEKNTLETLQFCLPSRIEYWDEFVPYSVVLEETEVQNLGAATIVNPPIPGHLYITVKDNTNWQVEVADRIFYNKVYITGTTRKDIKHTEVIPIRYNGTFKTVYEWKEIEEVFVSYFSDTAKIIIESFNTNNILDSRNISVSPTGVEKQQFLTLDTKTFGSAFATEIFAANDYDTIRAGMEDKDQVYQLELLDSTDANVNLSSFISWPNTDLIFGIDDTKLYVYDIRLPYNDCKNLEDHPESKFDLYVDRHFASKDDILTIKTRNLAVNIVPYASRWILTDPDGLRFYVELDGTLIPIVSELWLENTEYSSVKWREEQIEFSPDKNGLYIITFEAKYLDEETLASTTLGTKTFVFVPAINPEVEFDLPVDLQNSDRIVIDSDAKLWLVKNDELHKLDIFFDYFLVDYESNRIWLREEYDSVRVVINA